MFGLDCQFPRANQFDTPLFLFYIKDSFSEERWAFRLNLFILYTQILIMFLLMGVGAFCYRRGIITDAGSKDLSALLINIVAPCLIIQSFQREYDPAMFGRLVQALLLSALMTICAIVIAAVFFRKNQSDYADRRMCVVFPNNGFMALPLLQALCGSDGVFVGSVYIVITNIFLWTYGVHTLCSASGKHGGKVNWKKIFFNPGTVGFYIGLLTFLTSFQFPSIIGTPIEYLSALNTPLAMIVLGVYLAQSQLLDILRDRSTYLVCLFRLLLIPMLCIVVALLLPWDSLVSQVMVISTATPCAIASSMFAQQFGTNYRYSSRIIAFSTLLSAISMPCILSLYNLFL
jgi:hypothetical protein